jgi:hypothetical protein
MVDFRPEATVAILLDFLEDDRFRTIGRRMVLPGTGT